MTFLIRSDCWTSVVPVLVWAPERRHKRRSGIIHFIIFIACAWVQRQNAGCGKESRISLSSYWPSRRSVRENINRGQDSPYTATTSSYTRWHFACEPIWENWTKEVWLHHSGIFTILYHFLITENIRVQATFSCKEWSYLLALQKLHNFVSSWCFDSMPWTNLETFPLSVSCFSH